MAVIRLSHDNGHHLCNRRTILGRRENGRHSNGSIHAGGESVHMHRPAMNELSCRANHGKQS